MRSWVVLPLVLLAACAAAEREYDAQVPPPPPPDAALPDAFEFIDAHVPLAPDAHVTSDAAPPDASTSVCGNGVREGMEECDDGNGVQTDGCTNGCKWARCGDGIVRTGVEECDDGNTANGDTCSAVCLSCAAGDGHFTWTSNNHCYTRFATAMTWAAGETECAGIHAHLATITSNLEDGAIVQNLIAGTVNHWIGFTDAVTEGTFAWITSEPTLGYSHFTDGEPNNSGDCVDTSNVGLWDDTGCGSTRAVLCEDEGWAVDPTTNHAYRFVPDAVPWSTAVSGCATLGAHLVTITSAAENSFVNAHASGYAWAGATDTGHEGTFVWLTGEPYVFTAYAAGEPNNAGGNENCIELTLDSVNGLHWNDLICTEPHGYICEID